MATFWPISRLSISISTWGMCSWTSRAWWAYRIRYQSRTRQWQTRPQIPPCFLIFSTLTGSVSSASSSCLPHRLRGCHRREPWISVVFVLVRRQNHSPRVLTSGSSFFVAGKRRRLIPYRYPAVSSPCPSCDHHHPRQIGVFVYLWNDARIQTRRRPRWPWHSKERHHTQESDDKPQ